MNCNCKSEVEARLVDTLQAQRPDDKVLGAELQGYSIGIIENVGVLIPSMAVHVAVDVKRRAGQVTRRTVRQTMLFSYCPWCGKAAK